MPRAFFEFRFALSLLAWLAVLPGCGGNSSAPAGQGTSSDEKSLFLMGALDVNATECLAKADATAAMLPGGVFDLALTSGYTAALLVENQLPRAGSAAETERVSLRSAEIVLTTPAGTTLSKYTTVGVGFLDGGTGMAAYGTMAITVIPTDVGLSEPVQNAEQLIAKIRVLGEALNGTMLTSNELYLPIRVCTGCLVQYPPSAADPTVAEGYRCTTAQVSTREPDPPPCALGQDAPFSCELCSSTLELCRDPAKNPSIFR